MDWPTDYIGELARRAELERAITENRDLLEGAKAMYAASPATFVSDCVWLYEPRNANKGDPVRIPAVLFPRQREFIEWMHQRYQSRTSGPVEKSRDSGATWMACAFSVWLWLFEEGASCGFGSRKEELVDRKGDPSSIFEKIRKIVEHLPHYLQPDGFKWSEHSNFRRLVNPANDATIVGEAGDNIGRGGRTSLYFIDESAHIERPQLIEASLTATTDCRIDISSPLAGTIFTAWCDAVSLDRKFTFDISDAPWHTEEWRKQKESELEEKGLGHIYRQEYLRDATAGISGQLIPAQWVEAAVNAHQKLGITPSGERSAALDVADGGMDRNALARKFGVLIEDVTSRAGIESDEAGHWAYLESKQNGVRRLRYDSIGVGAGAKAALREVEGIEVEGWAGSNSPIHRNDVYVDGRTHGDMFQNAKAQGWWLLRDRFRKTFRAVEAGRVAPDEVDEIIAINGDMNEIRELKSELSQVTYKSNPAGKVVINKAPDGQRSPNLADAVMIACAPIDPGVQHFGVA